MRLEDMAAHAALASVHVISGSGRTTSVHTSVPPSSPWFREFAVFLIFRIIWSGALDFRGGCGSTAAVRAGLRSLVLETSCMNPVIPRDYLVLLRPASGLNSSIAQVVSNLVLKPLAGCVE